MTTATAPVDTTTETALEQLRSGTAPKFVAESTGLTMGEVVALAELNGLTPGSPVPSTTAAHLAPVPAWVGEAPAKTPAGLGIPSVSRLLGWADGHQDAAVRDSAAQARQLLLALQTRQATDSEIATLTTEINEIERRRQELTDRLAALQPAPAKVAKAKKERDYDAKVVRQWAADNGVEVSRIGVVARSVVDAWRQATQPNAS
ncbi:hypothetical protein [Streptacidiphilus sp. EB129]|uniref:hypothetical protein n=1 Tax=Streptacidiphilus sp. EB129 TaxID=3156262 RepID=UPI00351306FC